MASSKHTDIIKSKPCILLAEDDQDDYFFFDLALTKCEGDFKLVHARDGGEAIEMLKDGSGLVPDLIITDLKMPRLNGFEFLAWLQNHPELSKLPRVVFSSSDEPSDHERAKALGARSYHVKPGNHRGFVEEVNKICLNFLRDRGI